MDNDQYYSSSDLGLVSALTLDFKIERVDHTNPKKVIFFFKNSAELQKKVLSFANNKLKVDAQSYYKAVHQVKTLIYERQREERAKNTEKSLHTD